MSDGALLLLVLSFIYLSECVTWVGRHSILFVSLWGRSWAARAASEILGSRSGSLHFLNPLPPFGRFHKVDLPPFSLSPERIVAFNSQSPSKAGRPRQSGAVFDVDSIREVTTRDTEVKVNGQKFAKIAGREVRDSLVLLLKKLRGQSRDKRERSIEKFWRPQFDPAKARAELAEVGRHSGALRFSCILQFILIFVALPGVSLWKGVNFVVLPGALTMELTAIMIGVTFFSAHRKLYPTDTADRVVHLLKMILCAPVSIRAVDSLTAPAIKRFHVLAVAAAADPFPTRDAFIAHMLRDLRQPVGMPPPGDPVGETCRWQNRIVERIAAEELTAVSDRVAEIDTPPRRADEANRWYCPRCLVQLSIETRTCPECAGIAMQPLEPDAPQRGVIPKHG